MQNNKYLEIQLEHGTQSQAKCFNAAWSSYIKDDQIIEQSHMVNICKYLEVTLSYVKLFIFDKIFELFYVYTKNNIRIAKMILASNLNLFRIKVSIKHNVMPK